MSENTAARSRLEELPDKEDKVIRLVTFNVNGIRTLFHYQPFSQMNQSLVNVFDYFNADIITFQELKTEKLSISKWGKVDGYYSFISLPTVKKGYSGVGCWVRMFPDDHPLHDSMKVVKAEEGITGCLSVKNGQEEIRYKDDQNIGIGGYNSLGYDNESEALHLDSEGRCVIIELACNMVIISTYCPANSTLTDEGQQFRIKFLKVLFKRIRNLESMGKKVVLMGDLNICRDLIDQAEALEVNGIRILPETTGNMIENEYPDLASSFILKPERVQRRLLNQIITDSFIADLSKNGCMIDTTRFIQSKKRLKMYTVWNTLKNTRSINYGSRIDFILLSSGYQNLIQNANILPQVMGSDHCPVYLDMKLPTDIASNIEIKIPRFEARYKYQLTHKNIFEMLKGTASNADESKVEMAPGFSESSNHSYKMTKGINKTSSIKSFFKVENKTAKKRTSLQGREILKRYANINSKRVIVNGQTTLAKVYGLSDAPLCKHGEKCVLKTSRTSSNYGKKFWACKRPKGESNNEDSSCDHFEWV
ncbi:hypothetical protein TPHA_0H00210 [Tetrapisispora phaffii CBS 4417]|uniref:DNA-(apurinic or apyrimidinic site) endonuclease 2 n=1 Tax=Tetrapisispora phaffii (strain ATCC 24235 / CBS 4417 / NBRC 1672 / NRRL Y-8282 / UCD 70-5) TaxID=1071381 RepID=G8BWS8_TETPH|nr:hypothetical protein TPHA_0H00210 [Tetrapisispora phaffii CBS 4417]CCE64232.1 hypothetical protein TPHA_0H00210 [Tetrapisispora phaffii CBS 4417]